MKNLTIIFVILVIAAIGLWFAADRDGADLAEGPVISSEPIDSEPFYSHRGALLDVTEGKSVRGLVTSQLTEGTARAGYQVDRNGVALYNMNAFFGNLPEPVGDDFYEGWIVRRGENMSVISTGKLIQREPGGYTNDYNASEDLRDHDFYVLTIEPNDGDPAPADHVLEGTMLPI